jgi:hypothetical protein
MKTLLGFVAAVAFSGAVFFQVPGVANAQKASVQAKTTASKTVARKALSEWRATYGWVKRKANQIKKLKKKGRQLSDLQKQIDDLIRKLGGPKKVKKIAALQLQKAGKGTKKVRVLRRRARKLLRRRGLLRRQMASVKKKIRTGISSVRKKIDAYNAKKKKKTKSCTKRGHCFYGKCFC